MSRPKSVSTVRTPAFLDAHVHVTATGLSLTGLDLAGTRSLAEALAAVERHARAGRGRVVLGGGWDDSRWPEQRPPTRQELDRAAYGGAVYLARVDVHSAVVSSALLAAVPEAAGLSGYDAGGLQRLEAHHAVRAMAHRSITPAQRAVAQRATRSRAASLGIGCLTEMSGPEVAGRADLEALIALSAAEPGPDLLAYWGELNAIDIVAELGLAGAGGDLFCDGSIGSHTAALSAPYADAHTRGALRFDDDEVTEHVRRATAAGVQAGFHVIGDAAIDQVVRAVDVVADEQGHHAVISCRHRLEHVEMPTPEHLGAMARLGMVASVQPAFDAHWGGQDGLYARRLGDRAEGINPLSDFHAAGIVLAFGSDAPVTPLNPWGGVAAGIAHKTPGAGLPRSVARAAAMTAGWHLARRELPNETYAVWAAADHRELDERALAGEPAQCLRTVVHGQVVHDVAPDVTTTPES
ncbi:MAG: amidohydrolase family protein [Geodermatophilaceae bacterium]|nr:amidohydrolase family protein [Geodermatophilaceae bacterium]